MFGKQAEKLIATLLGGFQALGAERTTDAFLGKRGRIDRVVQKPRSVVIPEVVIGVRFADAKGGEGEGGGHDA